MATNENVCSLQTQPMKTFVVPGSEIEVHRAQHRVAGPLNSQLKWRAMTELKQITTAQWYETCHYVRLFRVLKMWGNI